MSKTVKERFADWLDVDVIADAVADEIEEMGGETTLENMQRVWCNFLEYDLHDGLKRSV